jgi:hypothetical protein
MANAEFNRVLHLATVQNHRQSQLLSLISVLCTPRHQRQAPDRCRLIVDSRLEWGFERIDSQTSWLYLSEAARCRKTAGCLVLTLA